MKWNMGWMNDTLRYLQRPHFFRRWHGDDIRFSAVYAFNENFVLPLSHDEVVYGKGSLLGRQPGDEWQRFAGLRNAVRPDVDAPGQEAAVHGRRVRPGCRNGTTSARSTGTCGRGRCTPAWRAG